MTEIVLFLFTFLIVFLVYYFSTIRRELNKIDMKNNPDSKKNIKRRKKGKQYDDGKFPVEVQYLVFKYHLDLSNISYKQLLFLIGVVVAFDLAVAASLVSLMSGMVWQILVGFVVLVPIIMLSFGILGKYYQKKGSKKDV